MLTRWNDLDRTLAVLDEFRRRMDRAFADLEWRGPGYGDDGGRTLATASWPLVNVYDAGANLLVKAELPGLTEKDVQLSLNQEVLSISGERKADAPEAYSVHRQERAPFKFSRSFTLPCKIDPEKTSAAIKDGVLTITLAKAAEAQPRQITVRAQ